MRKLLPSATARAHRRRGGTAASVAGSQRRQQLDRTRWAQAAMAAKPMR
jgi:hypothetical protein